ncbi:fimbrial protein [Novosphingobium sp.]|uniref:fimbrial protein n=1 Tax=Novosphingobium sp. TaxID=1874826 RepID=UPI003D137613
MIGKIVTATAVAFCALFVGTSAYASDGTITFTGNISSATCTVKLGNGANGTGTIILPNVSSSVLSAAAQNAGATAFAINLSACTTGKTVNAFFEAGTNVDLLTGNLLNTGTATGVEVQLQTAAGTNIAVGSPGQATNTGINTTSTPSGTLNYIARYYATAASAAGTVVSTVTYSITYL